MTTTPTPTARRSSNLPREPADYAGLTRGPRRAWWRPLLSLLLMLALTTLFSALMIVSVMVLTIARGRPFDTAMDEFDVLTHGPSALLLNNLWLAISVPAVIIATTVVQRVPRGFVFSVAGRFRWRWFARVTLCLLPVMVLTIGAIRAVNFTGVHPEPAWGWYVLVALLSTPLQTAGEEFAFRAWPLQNLGGCFRIRWLAWSIPTLLSASLFALMHGSRNPWVLLDLVIFSCSASLMIWRTGGIEAAIALHALNNVVVLVSAAALGGLRGSFITDRTVGDWDLPLTTLVIQGLSLLVVFWAARRYGIARMSTPASAGEPGVRLGERPG